MLWFRRAIQRRWFRMTGPLRSGIGRHKPCRASRLWVWLCVPCMQILPCKAAMQQIKDYLFSSEPDGWHCSSLLSRLASHRVLAALRAISILRGCALRFAPPFPPIFFKYSRTLSFINLANPTKAAEYRQSFSLLPNRDDVLLVCLE